MSAKQVQEPRSGHRLHITITPEMYDGLVEECAPTKTPIAQMIRTWIDEKLREARRARRADDAAK